MQGCDLDRGKPGGSTQASRFCSFSLTPSYSHGQSCCILNPRVKRCPYRAPENTPPKPPGHGFDTNFDGAKITRVGDGEVEVELEVTDKLLNPYKTLHGGATCTLVDLVGTLAIITKDPTKAGASVELNVRYDPQTRPCLKGTSHLKQPASKPSKPKNFKIPKPQSRNKPEPRLHPPQLSVGCKEGRDSGRDWPRCQGD